jgi:biotin operon repressor
MQDHVSKHIAEEVDDMYSSWRWESVDTPGSARVPTLDERVNNSTLLSAYRTSDAGRYMLTVIELYEEALNDDWMPREIAGLRLGAARAFIRQVAEQLRSNGLDVAVENLRKHYSQLTSS